ncbi:VOC family protein [Gorillibacterium timonense]|uniref:hypothetical protein n=1 Tax=Gorillibacterium timonense TaxID=1689269 RepID=UPI00071DA349|nr:hypothetical protein [Gorillibacterium timonense]
MKICPQIYVRGSIEAVEFYTQAFSGTLGFNVQHEDGTYEHASIMMGDSEVLALCENEKYTSNMNGNPVMQFCLYDLGTEKAVFQAYQVLKIDAIRNDNPNGPESLPWNRYCFALVDKYNIFWWIAI